MPRQSSKLEELIHRLSERHARRRERCRKDDGADAAETHAILERSAPATNPDDCRIDFVFGFKEPNGSVDMPTEY